MEGASNGGMLYHEVQELKLCAVHCVNTVLQGPFFSEFDLASLASDLDRRERQIVNEAVPQSSSGDFLSQDSHNVSVDGNFSIQVLERALHIWDLQVIPLNSPAAESAQANPELENAFVCHLQDHWFCIRQVNGEWYNFDSLYAAPQNLSKFYLSAYLDTLKASGWSIFVVRGNFPRECPMSSAEAPSRYGQWLTPEDSERISKTCTETRNPAQRNDQTHQMVSEVEDADLRAAIAVSLMGGTTSNASLDATTIKKNGDVSAIKNSGDANPSTATADATSSLASGDAIPSKASGDQEENPQSEDSDLRAAIAFSLMDDATSNASPDATTGKTNDDVSAIKNSGDANPSTATADSTPSLASGDVIPSKASGGQEENPQSEEEI